jgi:hypothetical protein
MAFAVMAIAPAAPAANAPVGQSNGSAELTQSQILEHLYGGSFTPSGDDFSNGSVEVKRIDDEVVAEQIFQGELVSARAVATFSRNTQTFGMMDGDELEPLFTATGSGLDVSGSADLTGRGLRNAVFALKSGGSVVESTGANSADPLIAYSVTGDDMDRRSFLLFWEDAALPQGDFDYNDLVVEVAGGGAAAGGRATTHVLIPLPAAAWSGLSVMGGVSLMAGLRKLRQRIR